MFGQAASLINRLMAGRISGAPWWRNVRKGIIFKSPSAYNSIGGIAQTNVLKLYPKFFGTIASREKQGASYFITPAQAFKDAFDKLVNKMGDESSMFFMYNPTQWSRVVKSGLEEIKIPGGESIFHQASTPPQTFSLELLLDNSLWFNSDSLVEALADHAVGALSRGMGDASGTGDLGLRELQFYHTKDNIDPFFSKANVTNYASLAPIIHWYETLCRPEPATKKCPEIFIAYQDMFARCIVESCTTTIMKSDWRQNINRATVALNFVVLENLNFDRGVLRGEKDLLTAAIPSV